MCNSVVLLPSTCPRLSATIEHDAVTVFIEQANPDEKARANTLAEKMCTLGTVVTLDQGDGDDAVEEFWAYLGDGEIQDADDDDNAVDEFTPLLFKLPSDGEPQQIAKGEKVKIGFGAAECKIPKDALSESDVMLLDAGWEVFLWMGKDADRSEKLTAFSKADSYCKEDPRTMNLPVTFIKSGYESADFNAYFA